MINVTVDPALRRRFAANGGDQKPCYLEMTVCWAKSARQARKLAHERWALAALPGQLFTELAQPSHFEAAFKSIRETDVAEHVICGPDAKRHVDEIRKAARAGYTHVCVHQVGSDQEGFFRFYEQEVLPKFGGRAQGGRQRAQRQRPNAA